MVDERWEGVERKRERGTARGQGAGGRGQELRKDGKQEAGTARNVAVIPAFAGMTMVWIPAFAGMTATLPAVPEP